MAATWGELFPPPPSFTEANIPSQAGRVFLITGGTGGIGYEAAKILYHLNGRVYITSRSAASAKKAIASIQASSPHPSQTINRTSGSLEYLVLNMDDLSTIKRTAEEFLSRETRLDVLIHNIGIMVAEDPKQTTAQGYHQQLGVNGFATFLLNRLLTPLLLKTASLPSTPTFSVRVIFVSSSAHRAPPTPDGVDWDDINLTKSRKTGLKGEVERYCQSKAMNVMQAHEFARRYHASHGIVSLSLHPGANSTDLQKNVPAWLNFIFGILRKHPRYGGLTELFAALAEIKGEEGNMLEDGGRNGGYVLPWGNWGEGHKEIFEALKSRMTGEKLWKLCEDAVKEFM
ncbi:hypothetical protein B0J14DRAFT_590772 [Halenospora varia]|nr:hypothetical protein B0J14DRAFT_590772 [Halenospora varia]